MPIYHTSGSTGHFTITLTTHTQTHKQNKTKHWMVGDRHSCETDNLEIVTILHLEGSLESGGINQIV